MQISTSVGVVQDILISLSFQKNAKLIMDPSRSQDHRDMRQLPCGRNWRVAHHCGVPERVRPMCLSARSLIDESALIAACSMRQAREATTSISRWPSGDLSMFAGYSARLRGHAGNCTHTRPQSATCASGPSGCSLRGCSSSRIPPPGVNSFAPAALFLGIGLFAPPSARAATWQS